MQFHLLFYLYYLYLLPLKVFTFPISATPPTNHPSQHSKAKNTKHLTQLSPEPSKAFSEEQREVVSALPKKNTRMVDEQKLLEERLQRLEQEISHSQASSNLRSSAGRVYEPLAIQQDTEKRTRGRRKIINSERNE